MLHGATADERPCVITRDPVSIEDLHATIYTAMGISPKTAYDVEKRWSKHPEEFGKGAIEGVAGPETANNAYANAALIPLFTLGIPGSPTIAILMGAFFLLGLVPGPDMLTKHLTLTYSMVWTIVLSNIFIKI